ncbi:MAG: hypothetical protein FWD21_02675 [Peptococcaceae bacterium]|nr:hypothetical protein [Peptococcaceae bacterium]
MNNFTIDYHKLYYLSNNVTPLNSDCGLLCGKLCCQPGKFISLGMYLYPGEEIMFTGKEDWLEWELRKPAEDYFPPSWKEPLHFIVCTKPCPRASRPLSCRFFPIAPHILPDNTLLLIHETMSLSYQCPLILEDIPLADGFVDMVGQCWQILLTDQRIRDLVLLDSKDREKNSVQPRVLRIVE